MSIAADTLMADTTLDLRRDVAGLRQSLRATQEDRDRLERRCERLEKALKLVRAKAAQFALEMERIEREI